MTVAIEQMTANELSRLAVLEEAVQGCIDGIQANLDEMSKALAEIRDKRYYRQTHANFEAYCQERFGKGRTGVNRLIRASQVFENLVPIGTKPANEWQVRSLTDLQPEDQREAWQTAVERFGDHPTGNEVAAIAGSYKQSEDTVELTPLNEGSQVRILSKEMNGVDAVVAKVERDGNLYWCDTENREGLPFLRAELELIAAPSTEPPPPKLSPREQISGLKVLLQATYDVIWNTASPTDELQDAVEKALE
ncbi:MAG: hypothetical protein AAFX78_04865 [Cyanobacteria bacterium J06638_20]